MKKLFVFFLFLTACGGSGAGNPEMTVNTPSSAMGDGSHLTGLRNAICSVLSNCASVDATACVSAINSLDGLDVKLGADSSYTDFKAMLSAESAGILKASSTAYSQCYQDISALSCSDSAVQAAAQSYSAVPAMIPSSCSEVF